MPVPLQCDKLNRLVRVLKVTSAMCELLKEKEVPVTELPDEQCERLSKILLYLPEDRIEWEDFGNLCDDLTGEEDGPEGIRDALDDLRTYYSESRDEVAALEEENSELEEKHAEEERARSDAEKRVEELLDREDELVDEVNDLTDKVAALEARIAALESMNNMDCREAVLTA